MFKHFWFIVGFVLIVGGSMAACTAASRALGGQNPVHQGMDWVNGKARQAEHDGTVANWIKQNGGDSRSMRPAQAPTPAPTTHKPAPQKSKGIKQKKR